MSLAALTQRDLTTEPLMKSRTLLAASESGAPTDAPDRPKGGEIMIRKARAGLDDGACMRDSRERWSVPCRHATTAVTHRTALRVRFALPALVAAFIAAAMASSAEAQTPIRIGASLSQTGPYAALGQNQLRGYQLCVKHANEKGGVLGRRIELVVEDDQSRGRDGGPHLRKAHHAGQGGRESWGRTPRRSPRPWPT